MNEPEDFMEGAGPIIWAFILALCFIVGVLVACFAV